MNGGCEANEMQLLQVDLIPDLLPLNSICGIILRVHFNPWLDETRDTSPGETVGQLYSYASWVYYFQAFGVLALRPPHSKTEVCFSTHIVGSSVFVTEKRFVTQWHSKSVQLMSLKVFNTVPELLVNPRCSRQVSTSKTDTTSSFNIKPVPGVDLTSDVPKLNKMQWIEHRMKFMVNFLKNIYLKPKTMDMGIFRERTNFRVQ